MKKSKTNRGFGLYEFKDSKGIRCSVQESSSATERAIWLGCDDADPQYFVPYGNPSWRPLKMPDEAEYWSFNTRMHLNKKQLKKLIPILQKFVETDYL